MLFTLNNIINFETGAPTVQPETQVTGGCMEGWYPYKNRCFQYHGFQQHEVEDRKNFDDASLECQKTTGATLAVIPDKMYNSFVYAHMYGSASGTGFLYSKLAMKLDRIISSVVIETLCLFFVQHKFWVINQLNPFLR